MASEPQPLPHSHGFSCPDPDVHDKLRAQGVPANRHAIYQIEFTSRRITRLLNMLQDRAVAADHYHEVEELAEMVMYIRDEMDKGDNA